MKKIIGTCFVIVLAIGLFFNSISINNDEDMELASLIAINVANAEGSNGPDLDLCSSEPWGYCVLRVQGTYHTFVDCEPDKWYTFADCY